MLQNLFDKPYDRTSVTEDIVLGEDSSTSMTAVVKCSQKNGQKL